MRCNIKPSAALEQTRNGPSLAFSKHSYCLTVGVPFLISSVSFQHMEATLRWIKLSIVLGEDSCTRFCWHDAHLPCNSGAQVMGLGPLQHSRTEQACIIPHCFGFSCTAEISGPIHCLGMFIKSHRECKEDLGLTIPRNRLRDSKSKCDRKREGERACARVLESNCQLALH